LQDPYLACRTRIYLAGQVFSLQDQYLAYVIMVIPAEASIIPVYGIVWLGDWFTAFRDSLVVSR
jgi:hypothetical protein